MRELKSKAGAKRRDKAIGGKKAKSAKRKLPRSTDEIMSICVSEIRSIAERIGTTPQAVARYLINPAPGGPAPVALMPDTDLTPDTQEYKDLRGRLAENVYDISRRGIANGHAFRQGRLTGGFGPLKKMLLKQMERRRKEGASPPELTAVPLWNHLKSHPPTGWEFSGEARSHTAEVWSSRPSKNWSYRQFEKAVSDLRGHLELTPARSKPANKRPRK